MRRSLPVTMLTMLCVCTAGTSSVSRICTAEPQTLYKASDVENAKRNIEKYRWAQQIVAGWQRRVDLLMSKDRPFVEEMIRELTPWPKYGQNCPACVNKQSSMGECNLYHWSIREPDQLTCK